MNETLNQKLLTRTKTAVVFGAIVIGLLSFSKLTNYIFLGLVFIFCVREYYLLKKSEDQLEFNAWMSNIIILGISLWSIFFSKDTDLSWELTALIIVMAIYSLLSIVHLYRPIPYLNKKDYLIENMSWYLGGSLAIALIMLRLESPFEHMMLKVIVLIWLCDSGAYLVGSRIGKTKLFPAISPNKTIEGSLGAGVITILGGMIIAHYFGEGHYVYWLLLSIVIWIFGTYGDLVQSSLKRELEIKDTGSLMPGHGGFLDRFDSFIFVWPFIGLLHLFIQA